MTQIISDHANLCYFTTKQTLTHRQVRWALFLSKYNYTIIVTPGKQNIANVLSLSLLLPVPPPWVQWSNELVREMYIKRALEKLKLEYLDSVSDSDCIAPDP